MNPQTTLAEATQLLSTWIAQNPAEAAAQKAALDSYGQLFRPDNIANITEAEFKAFLLLNNNKHWANIHRYPNIYSDMPRLKTALSVLVDEKLPVRDRLDQIIDKSGPLYIRGLGRAVLTPILMCVYPTKYAVYNRISDEALRRLGHEANPKDSFGKRYDTINEACHKIAAEINRPLYLVDLMFSLMVHGTSPTATDPSSFNQPFDGEEIELAPAANIAVNESFIFPLEKFLEEFLVVNWDKTLLGKSLALHAEDEESATQYHTGIGDIDILARDKNNHDWIVIELKKGKQADVVIGQILRYMGWVKKHKAKAGENVRGIIITSAPDDRIKYAMLVSQDVSFYTYRVGFDLVEEKPA